MFCSKCGKPNDDSAQFCSSCGNMLRSEAVHSAQQPYVDNRPIRNVAPAPSKNKGVFAVLAFLLGCWGAHWFYLNQPKKAVVMLIIGLFGLIFFLPLLITGIWALVDLIMVLCMSDDEFNRKYNTLP